MKTRTRYINKLEELGALVNQLSEKTVLDVRAAGRALAGDADAAESVLSGSKAARRLREAIEDGCLDIMLMQQPLVADDLREVTGAFRLVSDLAHIDEMTRDVAYLSQQLTPKAVSHLQSEFADAADKVSKMVSLAAKAFSQADAALAQRVFAMDDGVDELYDRCEQVVGDLIRSETQGASHLPELLMVAKYFERMGDEVRNAAKGVRKMSSSLEGQLLTTRDALLTIHAHLLVMTTEALLAVEDCDVEKARAVLARQPVVVSEVHAAVVALVEHLKEGRTDVPDGLELIRIAKSLERVGAHLTNVAEAVVFIREGVDIRHETSTQA